jgi:hypothetical protein
VVLPQVDPLKHVTQYLPQKHHQQLLLLLLMGCPG